MPSNRSNHPLLPLAAGLASGYVQNALTRKIATRLNRRGGVIQRLLVSLLISWLVGKLVRRVQATLTDHRPAVK